MRTKNHVPELLRGVEFSVNCPDLYSKAMEKLELYASAIYENGAEIWKSLTNCWC